MVCSLTKIKIVYYKISQMVGIFLNKFQILIIIVSVFKFIYHLICRENVLKLTESSKTNKQSNSINKNNKFKKW